MFSLSMIEESGAKFEGIQKIEGKDKYAVATDLQTHSTYYFPIKGLTKKKIRTKLENERKKLRLNSYRLLPRQI